MMKSKMILLSFLLIVPASVHAWWGGPGGWSGGKVTKQKSIPVERTTKTRNIKKQTTRDVRRSTTKTIKKKDKRNIKRSTTPTRSKKVVK